MLKSIALKKVTLLLSLFVLSVIVYGQSYKLTSDSKKAIKFYKQAESFYRQQKFPEAELDLKKAIKHDDTFIEAMLLLGDIFREQSKNQDAIDIYEEAIDVNHSFFPPSYYFLGDLYLEEEEFDKAINAYNQFLIADESSPERVLLAKFGYENAIFRKEAIANPVIDSIYLLDTNVNSNHDEYINFVNDDLESLVFTKKDFGPLGILSSNFREYFMESRSENNEWSQAVKLIIPITEDYDVGGMNLSFDGKQMYFTGCHWPNGMGSCDIYSSNLRSGKWSKPYPLSKAINSASWESQASISPDGRKLYFSSRRKGGKGGSDIWLSIKLKNGEWSPAINLGDSINTAAHEMAPHVHADGRSLYYSSNGTIGMGGFDLLLSKKTPTGEWTKGQNLGYPINTSDNEINIFPSIDGTKAWISSKRESGYGGFDIYYFELPEIVKPESIFVLNGIVRDSSTNLVLEAKIEITNLNSSELSSISTSDPTNGEFISVLYPDIEYVINISKPGYFFYSGTIELKEKLQENKTFKISKIQAGISMDLQNVYFDTDKWDINAESYPELDKLVALLSQNPNLDILIEGHTDNSGNESQNLILSNERAKSVLNYLISKNISPNRLSYKGFGSEIPISNNDTEQGKALNRRTRISVL